MADFWHESKIAARRGLRQVRADFPGENQPAVCQPSSRKINQCQPQMVLHFRSFFPFSFATDPKIRWISIALTLQKASNGATGAS